MTIRNRISLAVIATAFSLGVMLPAFAENPEKMDTMSQSKKGKETMGESKDTMGKAKDSMGKDAMGKDAMGKDAMGKDPMKKDEMAK